MFRSRVIPVVTSVLLTTGCSSFPSPPLMSSVDSRFKLARIEKTALNNSGGSSGVKFYKNVISRTLASDCDYFPSDSRYHLIFSRRCGVAKATVKSMARFLSEPDASRMYPVVIQHTKLYSLDLPDDCSLL